MSFPKICATRPCKTDVEQEICMTAIRAMIANEQLRFIHKSMSMMLAKIIGERRGHAATFSTQLLAVMAFHHKARHSDLTSAHAVDLQPVSVLLRHGRTMLNRPRDFLGASQDPFAPR